MARQGEWINFEELCRRVPTKSPRTLRRYIKARMISYRQLHKGCPMDFNWLTVQRDLALLEMPSAAVEAGAVPYSPDHAPDEDLRGEIQDLRTKLDRVLSILEERKAS